MRSLKRRRETDLLSKVAAGEPLEAESLLLRSLCDSARGLPAAAEEWDVSGLLLDGQPFTRETVSCWLSCAYSAIHGIRELSAQQVDQLSTVTGLTQVLVFADAVGSYEGLSMAACSQSSRLKLVVQLPGQVLELHLADHMYSFHGSDHTQLVHFSLPTDKSTVATLSSAEQWRDVQRQVAKQLSLLQLAHLQPLLDVLHQFVFFNNGEPGGHRLLSSLASVFTDAVLQAAQGSSTLSKEAYVSSVLSQPCSLTPGVVGHSSLLRPPGPPTYSAGTQILTLDAVLLQSFAGAKAGDTVRVVLDFFGTGIAGGGGRALLYPAGSTNGIWLPAQLLLGRTFSDAAALEGFLGTNPPAE